MQGGKESALITSITSIHPRPRPRLRNCQTIKTRPKKKKKRQQKKYIRKKQQRHTQKRKTNICLRILPQTPIKTYPNFANVKTPRLHPNHRQHDLITTTTFFIGKLCRLPLLPTMARKKELLNTTHTHTLLRRKKACQL